MRVQDCIAQATHAKVIKPLAEEWLGSKGTMANQMIEAGSAVKIPFRGRQNAAERFRTAEARAAHRITDRRLIRKVRAANGRAKRAFDLLVASLALVFLAPLLVTVAALIKLNDGGPIFYSHRRIGRQGERFWCLKFRTMAVDADERLADILLADARAAEEWQSTQKLRRDPRVTGLGVFLRKSSIDELPQIWNVFRGDMSIIGPRPITRAELNRYGRERRYYLLVRPGITGLWQVSGRSSASFDKRIRLDRQYLEEWSWLGEFWIMLMTIPALLNTKNAY
jgi:exopolysaccharide production protein ExoY